MHYRQLGSAGVQVSVIGMGTNQFGRKVEAAAVPGILDAALDLGINFIDTADVYTGGNSETSLGHALKGRWDRFVVATKGVSPTGDSPNDRGASRYHLLNAVENSLRRLQTDHIDLYQLHRWDPTTPLEETLRALDDLISSGKVRYLGASNFTAWQLAKANLLAELRGWTAFVSIQNHYHMLERGAEQEMLPYCQADNIGFIPFFPLAGGFLTGKYTRAEGAPAGSRGEESAYVQRYMTDANYTKVEKLSAWAAERDHSMAELAHAWLLAQPQVCSVISGLTKVEHLQANAQAAAWTLSPEEIAEVNALLAPA
jgi:aryl-alcohol dehydrogenase-like predicted oxidoreductase